MASDTPLEAVTDLVAEEAGVLKHPVFIERGTRAYRNTGMALFLGGFASFSLIYCVQPLLPQFAETFQVSPATSSLALSLTTVALAAAMLVAGPLSQALDRRALMFTSMALAAILGIGAGLAPNWYALLALRTLEGAVLGGVPAVAMAWLAEEIEPAHLGKTMGLYVAGTAFGGISGRIVIGILTEFVSWQGALAGLSVICLAAAIGFRVLLPASRNFVPHRDFHPRVHIAAWTRHLRNPGLLRVFAIAYALMSIYVTLYNYLTFRLTAPPYELSQTGIGLVFMTPVLGVISSAIAGGLADRFGRRPLLVAGLVIMFTGIGITLSTPLPVIICGMGLISIGFFMTHSVASGAIGPLAGREKGHATSLYLLFYYLGSSVTGSFGGWVWQHGGWPALAALAGSIALIGVGLAATLKSFKDVKV